MKELLSSVTSKGQVTIPVEVRRLLGVEPYDKVAFVIENGQVRLARRESAVARTAGALKYDGESMTPQELRQAAEQAIADDRTLRESS